MLFIVTLHKPFSLIRHSATGTFLERPKLPFLQLFYHFPAIKPLLPCLFASQFPRTNTQLQTEAQSPAFQLLKANSTSLPFSTSAKITHLRELQHYRAGRVMRMAVFLLEQHLNRFQMGNVAGRMGVHLCPFKTHYPTISAKVFFLFQKPQKINF